MVTKGHGSLTGTVLLVVANLLIPISIITFATGFFPYKPFLPGLAVYENLDYGPPPGAQFDRMVFMVVDALRSDFVYSEDSGFRFTQQLIRDGSAVPFTAHARSPTVTMPRIKAITTGSIPSFVDLILNFDEDDTSSTLAAQDTWLAQLKAKGAGKLLMYGDDTWLKLFPETFDREDGTTSFFVSDFTEVDNNVTRNVAGELESNDWGLMVLHYLGLDHIGHKAGPRSPNMLPKQEEMDEIVRSIYQGLEAYDHLRSTLLVLCGDHGMNDAGNHGASSPGETSPALVFISPRFKDLSLKLEAPSLPKGEFEYYSKVEQSDLAPTIAAFLGFPVSKNNLGAFIPDFLPLWAIGDRVQILVRNAKQILQIVTATFGSELFDGTGEVDPCQLESTDVNQLACGWRRLSQEARTLSTAKELDPNWVRDMSEWLRRAQDIMSSMASNYDMPRLFIGQGLAIGGLITAALAVGRQAAHGAKSVLPLLTIAISYGIMMFASSYVEEEHHFWYWCSTLWLTWLILRNMCRPMSTLVKIFSLTVLLALRLTRGWNQTGQKFAGEPDIVKSFIVENPSLLWLLTIAMYTITSFRLLPVADGYSFLITTLLVSAAASSSFTFKLAFTGEDAPELVTGFARAMHDSLSGPSLLARAQLVFSLIAALGAVGVFRSLVGRPDSSKPPSKFLHNLYCLLAMTQTRATNIPLFLLASVILDWLQTLDLSVVEITTTSILLQYASFFAFGGSNAISSVDLSNAYNGVSGFNIVAVGFLTLVSNWAGPIFWTSATNLLLLQKYRKGNVAAYRQHLALLTVFTTASVAFVMAACTALRAHLFIWTVFSPKYLYCMAWSLGQHLLINTGFGSLLFWLGAR